MSFSRYFHVRAGRKVSLKDYDAGYTAGFEDERDAAGKINDDRKRLAELQDKFLAHETHALLLIFQGMDGAGKDGTIKQVMSSIDPQGCKVAQLSKPAGDELKQDYLRRWIKELPERGKIGIFNRSYYEEVLGTRIHPERLVDQNLPRQVRASKNIWRQRFAQINNFEQYLSENGFILMKFFLHLSKEKQRERLLERLELPEKKWKFSANDIRERGRWSEYQKAYEDVLSRTNTKYAPWFIIPADHRWLSTLAVADLVTERLEKLKLRYPSLTGEQKKESERARRELQREK